ncbi:hypothetical protein HPGCJGGD_2673 [Methylobacterium haplocladii]|nr:hypothetical protein HPGCJGGD_2673 [Methylobacterium haplocladii]
MTDKAAFGRLRGLDTATGRRTRIAMPSPVRRTGIRHHAAGTSILYGFLMIRSGCAHPLAPLAGRGPCPLPGHGEAAADGEGASTKEPHLAPPPHRRFGFAYASRMDDEVHAGLSPRAGRGGTRTAEPINRKRYYLPSLLRPVREDGSGSERSSRRRSGGGPDRLACDDDRSGCSNRFAPRARWLRPAKTRCVLAPVTLRGHGPNGIVGGRLAKGTARLRHTCDTQAKNLSKSLQRIAFLGG